jgi:hypothetical protein
MDNTQIELVAEAMLSHFTLGEIMDYCTLDEYEILKFLLENEWIELPPFLEQMDDGDIDDYESS